MTRKFLIDTWAFFRANFSAILLIVFPFTIPLEIFSSFYYQNMDLNGTGLASFVPAVVYLLVYPIFGAAIVFFMASVVHGRAITTGQAWMLGITHWPSYFLLTVVLVVAIGIGFAAFILPGLFLAARLAFSEFELLLNKKHPLDSLKSSWASSQKYFWVLLSGGLLITFVIYGPYYLIAFLLNETGLHSDIFDSIFSIIESVLTVLYTIYAFRVYDFATRQEGASREADA